jgi:uncharacterized protein (TIGR00369 family)
MNAPQELSPTERAAELARDIPAGCAIDAMGIRPVWAEAGTARAEMTVEQHHLNQVGVVQGGVNALFADAVAGWAAMSALPDGKTFVTLEMRINLLRATRPGRRLLGEAKPIHLGGTTLVFGVTLYPEDGSVEKPTAYFICTQLVVENTQPSR